MNTQSAPRYITRYTAMATEIEGAADDADVGTIRKKAISILFTGMLRSEPPRVRDHRLKQTLTGLLRDAHGVATYDDEHRQYTLGKLKGCENLMQAQASSDDSEFVRRAREALVQAFDILHGDTVPYIKSALKYAVKIATALEGRDVA